MNHNFLNPNDLWVTEPVRDLGKPLFALQPSDAARDIGPTKVIGLLTGYENKGVKSHPEIKKLVRASNMTPRQLCLNVQNMLIRTRHLNVRATSNETLPSFWFDREVSVTGGQLHDAKARSLSVHRQKIADWITTVIAKQEAKPYILVSDEGFGGPPETIRTCAAPLLGFKHVRYSTMFFEPIIATASGDQAGLLPHGFRAHGDLFMEIKQPLLQVQYEESTYRRTAPWLEAVS